MMSPSFNSQRSILLSAHKDAAAVAPVFEIPQVALGDKRGTLTGDCGCRQAGDDFRSRRGPIQKGDTAEENKPPRVVGGNDFKTRFVDGWKFRHRDRSVPGL